MTREEQVGHTLLEKLPAHRESDLFDEYRRVVETGEPLVKEGILYEDMYNGERLQRFFDVQVVKSGDGFIAYWYDVTDRKRTEQSLQEALALLDSLYQAAPVGLAFLDADLRFRRVNQHMAGINGVPADAHLGKRPSELLSGIEEIDVLEEVGRRVLATGEAALDVTSTWAHSRLA